MYNKDMKFYGVPGGVKIYVDGSGIPSYRDRGHKVVIEDYSKGLEFLSEFNDAVKERDGGILTVDSVLEEIGKSVNHYKNIINGIKNSRNKKVKIYKKGEFFGSDENRPIDKKHMDEMFYTTKRRLKEYRRLCVALEEGMSFYGLTEDFDLSREKVFVDLFNDSELSATDKLSVPDKDLVISALGSGDDRAIFSADKGMIFTYYAGVKNFGLEGCFICDSRQGRSYPV